MEQTGDGSQRRGVERRTSVRHRTNLVVLLKEQHVPAYFPAQAQDLSRGGIGVEVSRRYPRGHRFTAELYNAARDVCVTQPLTVVHARVRSDRDVFLGCAFDSQLTETEFRGLR